ncbi:MAG: hypothetical protein KDA91_24820 [Planctomycetaceae bacterium]|nr:hypothetical protein [Planctomycetaceae bacterium]
MNGKRLQSKTFVGTVFSLTGNNLTVKARDGKISTQEETYIGQHIRLTSRSEEFDIVSVIESLRDNAEFPFVTGVRG